MSDRIKLVQGDTGPDIDVALTDDDTGDVVGVGNELDVVRMYFRKAGSSELIATIVATKPNGGTDGVVRFSWSAGDLDDAGNYEGEVEITFSTGKVQTMYDILKFKVRSQIG